MFDSESSKLSDMNNEAFIAWLWITERKYYIFDRLYLSIYGTGRVKSCRYREKQVRHKR